MDEFCKWQKLVVMHIASLAIAASAMIIPGHCIAVPPGFQLLGSHGFTVGDVSSGVRTIYGISDERGLQKLLIIQNEAINPGNATRYVYPLKPSRQIAGLPFKATIFASSTTLSLSQEPGAETAQTIRFLGVHHLKAGDLWIERRYAWHDDAGQIERLIFYMKTVDENQLSLQNLGPTDFPGWLRAFHEVAAEADVAIQAGPCA